MVVIRLVVIRLVCRNAAGGLTAARYIEAQQGTPCCLDFEYELKLLDGCMIRVDVYGLLFSCIRTGSHYLHVRHSTN
jgi:hypothetical protein